MYSLKIKKLGIGWIVATGSLFVLGACTQQKEQTFIDLNKDTVTLNDNNKAIIKMKTNKDAKYTVLDTSNDNAKLFTPKTTKSGEVRLTLTEAGKYKVRVSNGDDTETKNIKVKSSKVSSDEDAQFSSEKTASGKGITTINKTMNTVGQFQYKVLNVKDEVVKNNEDNWTDAEENMEDADSLNNHYYRTTIKYELKNVGTDSIDLSYNDASIILENGSNYTDDGNVGSYCYDSIDTDKILPNTIRSAKFILISNSKINTSNFKISVSDQCNSDGDTIADGGTASIQ